MKLDSNQDFEKVFRDMIEYEICVAHAEIYQWYAHFLEIRGKWQDAHTVYNMGILRYFSISPYS